jgi:transcriptional regulator with XRE-family HTH domain
VLQNGSGQTLIMRGVDVKEWRLRHGLTQRRLAVLLDVEPVTVSRWERGERQPQGRMLELALWALDRQMAEQEQT